MEPPNLKPLMATVGIENLILKKYARIKARQAGWLSAGEDDPEDDDGGPPQVSPPFSMRAIPSSWGKLKRRYLDMPGDQFDYGPGIGLPEDDPDYETEWWPNRKF